MMMAWIKALFCRHVWKFYRNMYPDEIVWAGFYTGLCGSARSVGSFNAESICTRTEMMTTESEKQAIPEVSMQQLIDAGFNAFGLQLFVESIAKVRERSKNPNFKPISFRFRGLKITFEPTDEPIDLRHH